MSATTPFNTAAIEDLKSRAEYEAWLLEAVYHIVDQRIAAEGVDELIYPPTGGPPSQTVSGVGGINIGDWRPGFLQAGAPLVLVTAFKLIDMIFEWVLLENGRNATHRFEQKLGALRGPVQFPTLLAARPWLQARLVSLYSKLVPLRGTIIHDRHFQTSRGHLEVSASKGGTVQPPVALSAEDLRTLSCVAVRLLRYLDGTWTLDSFGEKDLRFLLDRLAALHGEPLLGQLKPRFLVVRVYVKAANSITVDLDRVRRDAAGLNARSEVLFDLRLVVVTLPEGLARAFLIPWNTIENASVPYAVALGDLNSYECPLPSGIDLHQVAAQLHTT